MVAPYLAQCLVCSPYSVNCGCYFWKVCWVEERVMNSQILPKLCQRSWVCGPKDSFIHPNRLFLNIFCVPGIPLGTWHGPQHFPGSALAVD